MRGAMIYPLWATLTGVQFVWVLIWSGLGVLTLALVALLITRWGQSRPLRKCIALSVWTHFLLALYALTVDIMPKPGHPQGTATNVTVIDAPLRETPDELVQHEENPSQPWEQLADNVSPNIPTPAAPRATPPPMIEPKTDVAALDLVVPQLAPVAPRVSSEVAFANTATSAPTPTKSPAADVDTVDAPRAAVTEVALPSSSSSPVVHEPSQSPLPESLTKPTASPPRATVDSSLTKTNSTQALEQLLNLTQTASASVANKTPAATNNTVEFRPPSIYQLRTSPDRGKAAELLGGSVDTEAAVATALRWLARNQSPDGRWDASQFGAGREARILGQDRRGTGVEADTGITGLALLAFLGAGHTHLKGDHTVTVRNGLNYLIRSQATDGNLGGAADAFAFMYCHGMASLALSEALGMTSDELLRTPVTRAVGYTIACQNRTTGGWRYRPYESGDTSQLGWQLMVLKSAELAGVPVPAEVKRRAQQFLTSVSSGAAGGLASYRPNEPASRTMTAEALWCKQFLGLERNHPSCDEAGDYVLGELPGASQTNLYYWYYATLSMYQLQGQHWNRWNGALTKTLTQSQYTSGPLAGSWDPDPVWGNYGGRVYATALGALCLEVYYRFLPLHLASGPAEAAR